MVTGMTRCKLCDLLLDEKTRSPSNSEYCIFCLGANGKPDSKNKVRQSVLQFWDTENQRTSSTETALVQND